jgi:prepilin-type N-terminal cleavage/methylation domain-containing protein
MNPVIQRRSHPRAGYTLIELLVVMGIIAVIASLILPITKSLKKRRIISVAQAQLNQVQTAIENYKSKIGFYPPDNPNNTVTNPLYFELVGTILDATTNKDYTTLDGSGQVQISDLSTFGVSGFVNSGTSLRGSDDKPGPLNFLKDLRPDQVGHFVYGGNTPLNAVLVCSVSLPVGTLPNGLSSPIISSPPAGPQPPVLNPWRYVSTNPTNNVGRFDLWVDLVIGPNVYRVSNWRTSPQQL